MVEIIKLNDESEDETFINKLNYESYFDKSLFFDLLKGIVEQGLSEMNTKQKDNNLSIIFNIYSYTTVCIISHFNKNDLYKIKNYTDDIITYLEIFREIIKLFINDDKLLNKYTDYLNEL